MEGEGEEKEESKEEEEKPEKEEVTAGVIVEVAEGSGKLTNENGGVRAAVTAAVAAVVAAAVAFEPGAAEEAGAIGAE